MYRPKERIKKSGDVHNFEKACLSLPLLEPSETAINPCQSYNWTNSQYYPINDVNGKKCSTFC
ncbi:hypothetical protein CR164_04880 [Prosthecochloris marina]|uniref:Uncharacterized protein n=1 Tax=Prosthecochloris marina TaxID=2017681 RepID=A0A317T6M4_9CHLB|nr:hypothetical protein CR164_04880 [Prosthecochloris marina]